MSPRLSILPLMLSVALFGFGCNPVARVQETAMKNVVENAIEKGVKNETGQNVDLDIGEGGFTMKGENGESIAMGENVKVPDNFPSEVPRYSPSIAKSVSVNAAKGEAFLILMADVDPDEVLSWYNEETTAKGWVQRTSSEMGDGNYAMTYSRADGSELSVLITGSEDQKQTTVTLTWQKNATE
jgi:hypothetical protein